MTTDTIVGERIKLNAEIVPSGISISNQAWTLPGNVMKDFLVTQTSSQVVPVGSLTNANVDFVWYDGANNRTVNYNAEIGNSQISGETTFNIIRPEASVLTVSTRYSRTTIDSNTGALEVHFGLDTPQTAGIRFTANSFSIPNNFSGDKQWVQLIDRTTTFALAGNTSRTTVNQTGLDGCYPYTAVNSPNAFDSPGIPLDPLSYVNVEGHWTMWYMFKPTGNDSSWVPLRKVDWSWMAEAQLNNSTWNLLNYTDPTLANQPTDMNAQDFPIWSNVVPSGGC